MQASELERPIQGSLSCSRPLRESSRTGEWMLLASLAMDCLFFLEIQWYVENFDCFAPWVPFVSHECQIVTTINVLGGFRAACWRAAHPGSGGDLGRPKGFVAKRRTDCSANGRPLSLWRFA